MHWVYKIASILAVILVIATGGLYAQNCEDTYPSGPSQCIGISDAHGHTLSDMLNIAKKNHVMLAKVTSESNAERGFERQITIFGPSDTYASFDAPIHCQGFRRVGLVGSGW